MSVRTPPFWHPWTSHFVDNVMAAAVGNDNLTATSWYRDQAANERADGREFSQHRMGWAVDVVGSGSHQFAKDARARGLVAVIEGDHVHVQLLRAGTLERLIKGG